MSTTQPVSGQWWDIQEPVIPKRSSLYNLEPIGIGTPHVESLTGYIQRLAHEHCLSTWMLASRKIGPLINKEHLSKNCRHNLSNLFFRGNTLNSTSSTAQYWVQALENLTGIQNLRFLTLLSFSEILPSRELFRKTRAWCPYCYADRALAEQPHYEPLVWTLNAVSICIHHKEPLQHICPKCNQEIPLLSRKFPLDYCSTCGEWLGASKTHRLHKIKSSEDEVVQQIWAAKNLGDLVALPLTLQIPLSAKTITKNLIQLAKHVTSGNINGFARGILMSPKFIQKACSGTRTPSLKNLLEICYQFNIPLTSFLTSNSNIVDSLDYNSFFFQRRRREEENPTIIDDSNIRKKNLDPSEIIAFLQGLLQNDAPPPSLNKQGYFILVEQLIR